MPQRDDVVNPFGMHGRPRAVAARGQGAMVGAARLGRGASTGRAPLMLVLAGFVGLGGVLLWGVLDRPMLTSATPAAEGPTSAQTDAGSSLTSSSLPASGTRLAAPEALAATRSGEAVLVDIRRPEEWAETGVAETAIPISIESHPDGVQGFLRDLDWATGGDRSRPLVLICRTGNRTAQLAPQLRQLGYQRVYTVDEGMAGSGAGPGWLARDLPLR